MAEMTAADQAVKALRVIRPRGPWTLASFDPNVENAAPHCKTFLGETEVDAMRQWIAERNGTRNLYVVINPTKKRMNKKPAKADMAFGQYQFVDCDPRNDESPAEAKERHRARLASGAVPPPTIIYESGNGLVALWRRDESVKLTDKATIAEYEALNKGIAQVLGGKVDGYDDCQNVDRLLRIPCTMNIPDARKRAKGRKIEQAGDVEYDLSRKYTCFDFPIADAPSIVSIAGEIGDAIEIDDLDSLNVPDRIKEIIERGRVEGETKEKDDSRSAWEFEAICGMLRAGVASGVILGVLLDERWEVSERVRGKANPEEYARKEIGRAQKRVAESLAGDFDKVVDETAGTVAKNRFKGMNINELAQLPNPEFILEGIILRNCLFNLYGPRKAGKTFFTIDLGCTMALGIDFHGLRARQGRVLHIVAEGNKASIRNRVEAWLATRAMEKGQRAKHAENWFLVGVPVHIDVDAYVAEFLAANPGKWDLIIIDTLMRNMVGHISDPKDMGVFIRGCDTIREKTGATVLVVHHEGKDKSRGGMGSIALDNAVDGIAKFYRQGSHRIFSIVTLREGDDSEQGDMVFELESVPLSLTMSQDGEEEQRSAVLKLVSRRAKPKARQLSASDRLLLQIHEMAPKKPDDLVTQDISRASVYRLIGELREQGYVAKDKLKLTAEGAEWIEVLQEAQDYFE
jgi:AAA domain